MTFPGDVGGGTKHAPTALVGGGHDGRLCVFKKSIGVGDGSFLIVVVLKGRAKALVLQSYFVSSRCTAPKKTLCFSILISKTAPRRCQARASPDNMKMTQGALLWSSFFVYSGACVFAHESCRKGSLISWRQNDIPPPNPPSSFPVSLYPSSRCCIILFISVAGSF